MKKVTPLQAGLISLLLLLSGCGAPPVWYKPDTGPMHYKTISRECKLIAQQVANQASVTGESKDLVDFTRAYNRCMYARGWSQSPHATAPPSRLPGLAVRTRRELTAFGTRFSIPEGFELVYEKKGGMGPTILHSFLFKDRQETYLNMIFQKNLKHPFEAVDYPVSPPFLLYHRGKEPPLTWAAFFGQFNNEWITGLGSYRRISKRERVALVLTAPLLNDPLPPPPGLSMTRKQRERVEAFLETWLPRIKKI